MATKALACDHQAAGRLNRVGDIVCRLCGAVWRLDWTGPPHWVEKERDDATVRENA